MDNIVQLADRTKATCGSFQSRIGNLLAIFHAIEAGEMLMALPECDVARAQHTTALTLLAMAQRELLCLHEDLST